jgi:hypothetical protein
MTQQNELVGIPRLTLLDFRTHTCAIGPQRLALPTPLTLPILGVTLGMHFSKLLKRTL